MSPDDDADDDDNIIAVYEPLKNCGRLKTNEEIIYFTRILKQGTLANVKKKLPLFS